MTTSVEPLTVDDVARWLITPVAEGGAGLRERIVPGPKVPTQPDRLVILTKYGGPGAIEEDQFEVLAFQARCRGNKRPGKAPGYGPEPTTISPDAGKSSYDDAENLAGLVDRVMLDAPRPARINGKHVRTVTGGPPQFLLTDNAGRVHFTANYLLTAARF